MSVRRMGPETSATRSTLMDAAEAVMREEGYGAVTSRSVAERAGVKHQLVYYYFQTMEDLLLAAYRRRTQQVLERVEQALSVDRPLHAFWQAFSDPGDAALTMEYLALANHNERVRLETIEFGERIRRLEAETLKPRFAQGAADPEVVTPYAMMVSITYIARLLGFEATLGVHGGHKEIRALVEWSLARLEPGDE